MFGAADALQERRDRTRRSQLANQINGPNVDAQLQRRGGNERFQFATLETVLRIEPEFRGKAPVMRRDFVLAHPFAQMMGHALSQATCVNEHERSAVRLDQIRQPVIDLGPDFGRHHASRGDPGSSMAKSICCEWRCRRWQEADAI
jgi:hypothetical protein